MVQPRARTVISTSDHLGWSVISFFIGDAKLSHFSFNRKTNTVNVPRREGPSYVDLVDFQKWFDEARAWADLTHDEFGATLEPASDFEVQMTFEASKGDVTVGGTVAGLRFRLSYDNRVRVVTIGESDGARLRWADFIKLLDADSILLAIVQREVPAAS